MTCGETILCKDGTRVECDDVDAAHPGRRSVSRDFVRFLDLNSLLGNHYDKGSPSSSLDSGNDEEFLETSEEAIGAQDLGLFVELSADVV